MLLIFISSGLFLGWSLGANDAANIFGTAVGSRMIRFRTAALIAGVFIILGAVIQGSGTTDTLGKLGSVSALAGSFTVALSAAIIVFMMTRHTIPVSTSQAIVGAIIGWNFYSGNETNWIVMRNIAGTWVAGPVMGAIFAILLYLLVKKITNHWKIHLLRLDLLIKISLVVVGAFGAYSLGANNIANVMGVFVPSIPLEEINILDIFSLTGAQQLFLLGGIAIAAGVFTYSKHVMMQVGRNLFKLSSIASIVVVLAHSLVLFIFSSSWLKEVITGLGLPPIPLVPVSSSQVIVGAIMGMGLLKGGRGVKYKVMGHMALGWMLTPVATAILCYFSLFFMENVFGLEVF